MALLSLHLEPRRQQHVSIARLEEQKYGKFLDRLALVAAVILIIGYTAIPIAVLTGVLKRVTYGA